MTGPVRAQALEDFIVGVFEALAVPKTDARTVAGMMVEADLLGYDTHGVFASANMSIACGMAAATRRRRSRSRPRPQRRH